MPVPIFLEQRIFMGIHALSLSVLILASVSQLKAFSAEKNLSRNFSQSMSEGAYRQVLEESSLIELREACASAAKNSLDGRLRELRKKLMALKIEPYSFDDSIAKAKALMLCKAPDSAQEVLSRFQPSSLKQKRTLLLLSWQAANASLDHASASFALRQLVQGNILALGDEQLTIGFNENGIPIRRFGLDLLADHEYSLGMINNAARILLSGPIAGVRGFNRLALVERWVKDLTDEQNKQLFESAIEMAMARQDWVSAEKILRLQIKLDSYKSLDSKRLELKLDRIIREVEK